MEEAVLICPLSGNECPGVDSCAPAIMGAVEVDKKVELTCPIAHVVSAASFIANRLGALVASKDEPEKKSVLDYADQVRR